MWETEPTGERKIGNMGSTDEKVWYMFVKKNNICFVKYCRNQERIETEVSTMKKTHTHKKIKSNLKQLWMNEICKHHKSQSDEKSQRF